MSAVTGIEWTDRTWNPVTGCDKVSPGCAHCYAEGVANRFWPTSYPVVVDRIDGRLLGRPRQFTDVMTHDDRLLEPLSWRKPARVFVNSMSDLFHEDVPAEFVARVFAVMALSRWHTYQILTKRPERMRALVNDDEFRAEVSVWITMMLEDEDRPKALQWDALDRRKDDARATAPDVEGDDDWPLPNVWLGVSVENQHFADERIPLLLQTPAAVRFISAEPLLGPLDLSGFIPNLQPWKPYVECRHGYDCCPMCDSNPKPALDWIIVGGESGPGARPFDLAWARSIVAQCKVAGVPVFVKQLGKWPAVAGEQVPGWMTLVNEDGSEYGSATNSGGSSKHNDPDEWPADLRDCRQFPGGPA